MLIQKVTDQSFNKYGKIIKDIPCSNILEAMKETPLPFDVIYVPSDEKLENTPEFKEFKEKGFGGLPIQIGYCNGHNNMLNALEYHRSSEINIAVTDMILLLGLEQDIKSDNTYDTSLVEGFFLKAGTVVEVYATTLHYAPCNGDHNDNGFKSVVILPKGTNEPLDFVPDNKGEISLITAANKWLIAHEDAKIEGAFNGLVGENITL